MPQMFPMNWILLFSFIIFMFYLSTVKLFFWGLPKPSSSGPSNLSSTNSNKWMW